MEGKNEVICERISVIVPIYNTEKYLARCIESILCQTYTNLEIILVDDGSTDKSGDICDFYARKDNRVKVVHKENGGAAAARNFALNMVTGQYIGFVDSDDTVEKDFFELLYDLICQYDADISMVAYREIEMGEKIAKLKDKSLIVMNQKQAVKELLFDRKIQNYVWNKLYKRELFKDIEYPVGKKYEDIGTTFYILEKCSKIAVSGSPEYYYITRGDSIVNNNTEGTVIDYISLISDRYDYIDKKYKELKKYNDFYITKTLITAYTDAYHLKNNSEEFLKILNNFFNKVKDIFKNNEEDILTLFSEEQKKQLDMLLKDKKLFYKLLEEKNDVK